MDPMRWSNGLLQAKVFFIVSNNEERPIWVKMRKGTYMMIILVLYPLKNNEEYFVILTAYLVHASLLKISTFDFTWF